MSDDQNHFGFLAQTFTGKQLSLQVLRSNAGYYIGTTDEEGPCSRESVEYYPTHDAAAAALADGSWTQRSSP